MSENGSLTVLALVVRAQVLPLLLVDDGEDTSDRLADRVAAGVRGIKRFVRHDCTTVRLSTPRPVQRGPSHLRCLVHSFVHGQHHTPSFAPFALRIHHPSSTLQYQARRAFRPKHSGSRALGPRSSTLAPAPRPSPSPLALHTSPIAFHPPSRSQARHNTTEHGSRQATHILLTLLLLPPVIFATRRLASSVLSSLSWVRRSCLFLRSVSDGTAPQSRTKGSLGCVSVDLLGLELESADLGRRRRHLAAAVCQRDEKRDKRRGEADVLRVWA